jgi:phosphatidylserine/phosphatidylglycerophosphate/cardiolipin synthase-like enzyme
MRKKRVDAGLTVNAVAGTHVVTLGLDLADPQRKGCLGFAIQREDHTEDEKYWMSGMKTFEETDPLLGPGGQVSSREHPFQSFQWADFSAKPEHDYTYKVVPLYGTPVTLTEGGAVAVRIQTEPELGQAHSAFFNRGSVATQEYARRFQNRPPNQLEGDEQQAAYRWLSRGLLEAFQEFVARAKDKRFKLFGAVYEFQWPEALQALKSAAKVAKKVSIIFDAIPGASGPKKKNQLAIAEAKISGLCIARTRGKIMHNKFVILVKDDVPIAVWTGSTNLTENGIFGHSNCGHIVEDKTVAAAYLEYWKQLRKDEASDEDRAWVQGHNPDPADPFADNPTFVFSPRSGVSLLKRYGVVANSAKEALFMSFAFGMNKVFQDVYEQNDGVLRFALMEKEGTGKNLAQAKIDIRRIRNLPNVVVAIGHNIATNSFDRWVQELSKITKEANIHWIHTKYMLVDPLGPHPMVVTGSANFSKASTDTNHENMLIIRDDTRVADIYLGEFMRLHTHYAFREAVKRAAENGETDWKPNHLETKASKWQRDYFDPRHQRHLRRKYFAQT